MNSPATATTPSRIVLADDHPLVLSGVKSTLSRSDAVVVVGEANQPKDDLPTLTAREKQILVQVALGHDNQTIANELSLAAQSVRNYASLIYEKLGVASRVEAVVWARDRGIT